MSQDNRAQSVQARIAALNLSHVGRAPVTADGSPPDKPPTYLRSQSTTVAQPLGHNILASNGIGNEPNGPRREGVLPPPTNIIRTGQVVHQPAKAVAPPPRLPVRKPTSQSSPALPPRRQSSHLSRKASNESVSSTISNMSSISTLSNGTARMCTSRTPSIDAGSRVKAPVFDPTTLPPLPPKRTKDDIEKRYQDIEKSKAFPGYKDAERARISLNGNKSTHHVATVEVMPPPTTPALPPRRSTSQGPGGLPRTIPPEQPPPMPARSALALGMNKAENLGHSNGVNGRVPSPSPSRAAAPPPIPLASRPDISKIHLSRPNGLPEAPPVVSSCLICRDFSGPDSHAAKFPRQNVPSLDWLATQLTSPFPSLTDKARAIFTWLHHNVNYDVDNFFKGNIQPSTPASTLATGLAVCEGYAGLFTALAAKAGLESVVIGGHGKGFGFSALKPGDPIPPESRGHAWNAVRIDNGQWKLIDPCWGAGHIGGKGQPYSRHFNPSMFTMSNEEFGLRHFPEKKSQFFRSDSRIPTWEEYLLGDTGGERLQTYNVVGEEGISETSFLPKYKHLPVSPSAHAGPTIRFQFSRVCEHWDPVRNGKGKDFVYILKINGIDGREDDFVPVDSNGVFWWADVTPQKLGVRGQQISVYTVDTVNGVSGRGLSVDEYMMAKGRKAMGFRSLAMWQLV
ncbi:hypothetical protein JMJ35_009681 [Cladonia borealis]|uniref:Transglutaminase-like domain-containing protein n=1 Tax=Cladonia borealis TaxID=184061 RepID=A0AA39UXU9_9LECA|nr:hypothetical protein JMJ35_009681 [Cladonia borealis]